MKITYIETEFDDNKKLKTAKLFIDKVKWLLPTWLQVMTVEYSSNAKNDVVAELSTNYEYRTSCMTIFPVFYSITNEEKERALYHEVSHVYQDPFHDYAMREISRLIPDESYRQSVLDTLTEKCEAATQDISFRIYNMVNNIKEY